MMKKIIFRNVLSQNIVQRKLHNFDALKPEVEKFSLNTPIEAAVTPPSIWFNDPTFHELDKVSLAFFLTYLLTSFFHSFDL